MPSFRVRLAIFLGFAFPAALVIWTYVAKHDFARMGRDFFGERGLTWPPKHKNAPGPLDHAAGFATSILPLLLILVAAAAAILAAALGVRVRAGRKRTRETLRYELVLGRDDVADPYHVQQAFESIVGAISARWHERLWRGQDHFALEIHRLDDRAVHFAIAAPASRIAAIRGPLQNLYPDVLLREVGVRLDHPACVVRLKKRRAFVFSLQTTKTFDTAFGEALVHAIDAHDAEVSVQLVLTPASARTHRRARRMLKRRERTLQRADHRDRGELGIDSVVEAKELKGALETQHRSLLNFDLRISGDDHRVVRQIAGLFAGVRSENELISREMRLRRRLYARRIQDAVPNPVPSLLTGVMSTSELTAMWHLPRARVKNVRLARQTVRRAIASPEIDRDPERALLRDERGPVALHPSDRRFGHALIGGQGTGKSSILARHFHADAADPQRAIILLDPKGPLAELCLGLAPADRTVHYLDLGRPEVGLRPLNGSASAGARAAVFLQALIDANPPGAIQAASDSFLRQAVSAVCLLEPDPTLWHVYSLLDPVDHSYRTTVADRLRAIDPDSFATRYWTRDFRTLLGERGFAIKSVAPPRNKIERLISTREIDTLLRHPVPIDLETIVDRGEILILAGAKSAVGEDNTILVSQLLLQLINRVLQNRQQQRTPPPVSLLVDEAHNILSASVARMLAEGRSAGLEAVFAWQYSAQIRDEIVRSGVRSLLQSISILRMREMEDARSLAGLAMEVYSDRIGIDHEEQERLRFSPDDIVRLPIHQAINLWVAQGIPRAGFVATTMPMEDLHDTRLADRHREAQRHRGGHHPERLPNPMHRDEPNDDIDDTPTAERPNKSKRPRGGPSGQLPLDLDGDPHSPDE